MTDVYPFAGVGASENSGVSLMSPHGPVTDRRDAIRVLTIIHGVTAFRRGHLQLVRNS